MSTTPFRPLGAAAGVVLAGGRSSRMGEPKAHLAWHGSTLLYRAAALLARTVDGPVVVVRAPGQRLPPLPTGVAVTDDPIEGLGPMQGVAAGLAAVADRADLAFVCSTDLPFLHPAFVRRVLRELAEPGVELVFPVARGYRQPLAAGYRTGLATLISGLLTGGSLRPGMLLAHCTTVLPDDTALLADPELAQADPELASVTNLNTPEDYAAALAAAAPVIMVECLDGLAGAGPDRPRPVSAATLAEAAATVSVPLARAVVTLNGEPTTGDGQLPLVTGDRVVFRPAPGGA